MMSERASLQPAAADPAERPVVFIVDSDPATRDAIETLVCTMGWRARTARSAEEFVVQRSMSCPCCLVVEQHLPGSNGFDLQDLLRDQTYLPIIFMSREPDVAGTVRAMKAGAIEFLTKPLQHGVLLNAIATAIEFSRSTLAALAGLRDLEERYESLSPRERQVMAGVVLGRLNKQVGGDLGISEITVKAHRGQAMRKMRARSLPELVRMAATLHSAGR